MTTAVAVLLFVAVTAYAVFGGADFGAGFWDLVAGGAAARRAAARGDRPLDRTGVGGQPRVADLLLRRAVDRLLRGLRLDHPDPVRPADARGVRDRAARIELRLPQDRVPHPRPPQLRRRLRPLVGARAVLLRRGRRRHRLGPGAGRRSRPAIRGRAGSTRRRCSAACSPSSWSPTSPPSTSSGTPAGSATRRWSSTSGAGPIGAAVVAGVVALVGIFVLRADAAYLFDELTTKALPLVILSAVCGIGVAGPARPRRHTRRPPARHRRRRQHRGRLGRGPVAVHPAREPRGGRRRRARRARSTRSSSPPSAPCSSCVPGFVLLYVLDQRSLLPDEGVD